MNLPTVMILMTRKPSAKRNTRNVKKNNLQGYNTNTMRNATNVRVNDMQGYDANVTNYMNLC